MIEYDKRNNQFVFAGRLDKLKGIELLLTAWKLVEEESPEGDDPELIICGTGPEEDWCEDFIRKENLKHVRLLGFLPNEALIKILSVSKALILPTQWYEGAPMTMIECMACGTPIIGSDIGNVSSLIEEGVNGLKFRYDSAESLKNSIRSITDMVVSTEDKFKKEFFPEANYHQLLEIYNHCILL
jgi:glycosyltransferase involved in cell wall biosynthesis